MNAIHNQQYEVVVIGGGAAGMFAAATAAAAGATVLLLEKNKTLGAKLSITGGGRCNVTNNKPEVREMLAQYKDAGKFLFSTFDQHSVADTIAWFAARGVQFVEENEGRLFPETHSAETISETLLNELAVQQVEVKSGQSVQSISFDHASERFLITTKHETISAQKCIIATGGYSRPETGSTGDGFGWAAEFGHTVVANNFALVPLTLRTSWTKVLSGISLSDVKLSLFAYGKRQSAAVGRMLFTHEGLSGPLVLNMSKEVGDYLENTDVTLMLDLFPDWDAGKLKEQLAALLSSNKKLQNALTEWLPLQLVKAVLAELNIDGETPCHSVRTEDRKQLRLFLKAVPLPVKGLLGADKAIISSGGVKLEEIDFKTMESKLRPGLYLVGDMLHINRPSGGYSLQLCWSTGFVAGTQAAESAKGR